MDGGGSTETVIVTDYGLTVEVFVETIGRYLMYGGLILLLVGGGIFISGRLGLPLGRLPGDVRIDGENGSFYFPITSSILISIVLTIVLNLVIKLIRK